MNGIVLPDNYFQFSLALFVFGCALVGHVYIWEKRRLTWFSTEQKQRLERNYSTRWLGLWHVEDEALSALFNVKNVSGKLIPNNILFPIVPVVLFALMVIYAIEQVNSAVLQSDGTIGITNLRDDLKFFQLSLVWLEPANFGG